MKQFATKSALRRIMAVILLAMGTVSASAQYYINVVQKNGETIQYPVSEIDSVIITDQKNYEYVDLGLSVKWATCNVGAEKPEDFGDYYCWGETETKSFYSWTNYKYEQDLLIILKYNFSSWFGTVDNKYTLEPDDDVAHVKWGGNWRLPSKKEQDELRANCTFTLTTLNGVKGCLVTSNKEGYTDRSIFLPAAGNRFDTNYEDCCIYMSRSLCTDSPHHNVMLYFDEDGATSEMISRNQGQSVRPVCP